MSISHLLDGKFKALDNILNLKPVGGVMYGNFIGSAATSNTSGAGAGVFTSIAYGTTLSTANLNDFSFHANGNVGSYLEYDGDEDVVVNVDCKASVESNTASEYVSTRVYLLRAGGGTVVYDAEAGITKVQTTSASEVSCSAHRVLIKKGDKIRPQIACVSAADDLQVYSMSFSVWN